MVPPSMRIQHALLDHRACQLTLCQLFQRGAISSEERGGGADTLHASRRDHWARHAIVHAAHVHDCACEDPTTEL